MVVEKKTSGFSIGSKYGLRGILFSLASAPFLLLIALYLDALRRGVEHWNALRIPLEVYCLAPIIGLVFFSIPYLLGSCILGWLTERFMQIPNWLSIIFGALSGLIGIALIALQQKMTFADFSWDMVIIIELWSMMIFSWIGSRIISALKIPSY